MKGATLFGIAVLLSAGIDARAAEEAPFADLLQVEAFLEGSRAARNACPAPRPGGRDLAGADACEVSDAALAESLAAELEDVAASAAPAVAAVNSGFRALGEEGAAGSVDGPGSKGNGRYRVLKNERHHVALKLSTGYMQSEFHLMRDPKTGIDTLRVAGKKWNKEKGVWGPYQDDTFEARFGYDASSDTGTIRYKIKGKWKQESYWDGKAGRSSMTIEFGGGWDHDLSRD